MTDPRGADFEILVKSFLRFRKLVTLVESVRARYPNAVVRVADDSPDGAERDAAERRLRDLGGCHFYRLPLNVGISVGRNLLLKEVQTPYFFLTDDDKVFTRRTKIEQLRAVLEADPGGVIAAAHNLDYGWLPTHQHGHLEREASTLRRYIYGSLAPTVVLGGVTCVPCRMAPNFFLARTAIFRERRLAWDERLKVNEHVWFYYQLPEDLHVYFVPGVVASHYPTWRGDPGYLRHRYDPAETTRLRRLEGLQIETLRMYETPRQRVQGQVGRWLRKRIKGRWIRR